VEIIAGTMQHYRYLKIIMFKNNKICLADQHICLRCRLMASSASLPPFPLFFWGGVGGCLHLCLFSCPSVYLPKIPDLQLDGVFFLFACVSMICRKEESLEHPVVSGHAY
jgi:hypothetical protein